MPIFKELFRNNSLLWFCSIHALKQRYAGHVLGLLWVLLMPLLLLSIYCVIYIYIFKLQPHELSQAQYVLYIFSGLVPFLTISESMNAGVNALTGNQSILKNLNFPSAIFPAQATIVSHLTMWIGLIFVIVMDLITDKISLSYLWLPFIFLLQFLLVLGLNFILSVLNVVIRDTQNLISFVVMAIMLLSPIAYLESMVPEKIRFLVFVNPFSYYFRCYQKIIAFNEAPTITELLIPTIISITVLLLGMTFFYKVRKVVSDYV